jgi:hypothetical protein
VTDITFQSNCAIRALLLITALFTNIQIATSQVTRFAGPMSSSLAERVTKAAVDSISPLH